MLKTRLSHRWSSFQGGQKLLQPCDNGGYQLLPKQSTAFHFHDIAMLKYAQSCQSTSTGGTFHLLGYRNDRNRAAI